MYQEHKYEQQLLGYGVQLERIIKSGLGVEVENIYTCLHKHPYFADLFGQPLPRPHETYRPQVFTPVVVWRKDNPLRKLMPEFMAHTVMEKRRLREDMDYFLAQAHYFHPEGNYLDKCYYDVGVVYGMLVEKLTAGEDIRPLLKQQMVQER
jgi:hypothetical protein